MENAIAYKKEDGTVVPLEPVTTVPLKKFVYLAHPIRGDVLGNQMLVKKLVRHIAFAHQGVVPVVPYFGWLACLDDEVQCEREAGFRFNRAIFERGQIDELWICGAVSEGVALEIAWCEELGIPVLDSAKWASEVMSGKRFLADLVFDRESGRVVVKRSPTGRLSCLEGEPYDPDARHALSVVEGVMG